MDNIKPLIKALKMIPKDTPVTLSLLITVLESIDTEKKEDIVVPQWVKDHNNSLR